MNMNVLTSSLVSFVFFNKLCSCARMGAVDVIELPTPHHRPGAGTEGEEGLRVRAGPVPAVKSGVLA